MIFGRLWVVLGSEAKKMAACCNPSAPNPIGLNHLSIEPNGRAFNNGDVNELHHVFEDGVFAVCHAFGHPGGTTVLHAFGLGAN
jgi:hypothetical protein